MGEKLQGTGPVHAVLGTELLQFNLYRIGNIRLRKTRKNVDLMTEKLT